MSAFAVQLLGKLCVRCDGHTLDGLEARKTQELFGYLLLYRDRPHCRETLASLLWGDNPTARSKKHLRQTLWQLQSALHPLTEPHHHLILTVEPDWIGINPEAEVWLDVAAFEQSYTALKGMSGPQLDAHNAERLRAAVPLYRGDLLEGCYEDWCLYERDRLQHMLLSMLDKLIDHAAANGHPETGLEYAWQLLCYDGARERTHRHLMRLYELASDRTAALRQYERCVAALDKDLGVKPSERTVRLYEQIRAGRLRLPPPNPAHAGTISEPGESPLPEVLSRLKSFEVVLEDVQQQVRKDIQAVERVLSGSA